MTDLEIILIIMLTAVTLSVLCYTIEDYIHTKKLEELKRKEDIHYIQEDIRLMKVDLDRLKMREDLWDRRKDLPNLFGDKEY